MGIIDLIFPKICLGCKKEGGYICKSCYRKVKSPKPICPVCEKASIDGFTHSKCHTPYSIDGLSCVFEYRGVVRKAILTLKYKFAFDVAQELVSISLHRINNNKSILPRSALLIPIPVHPMRKNWRGFNQVELMGKYLSGKKKWTYSDKILIRKKITAPQALLKGEERKTNIKNVFGVDSSLAKGVKEKEIILFDDVFTTGATLREAAKTLKRNGFLKVWGLSLAR